MCFNEEKLFYIVLVDPYEEYGGFSTWFSPFVVILFVVSHVSCTMLDNVQCFSKRKSYLVSCQLNPYIKAIRILHNWPFLSISLKIGMANEICGYLIFKSNYLQFVVFIYRLLLLMDAIRLENTF